MRTTIEIPDEQRARLLDAAARRGEKGFSAIVVEALDRYFDAESVRMERVGRALAAIGSLTEAEAAEMEAEARHLRETWR